MNDQIPNSNREAMDEFEELLNREHRMKIRVSFDVNVTNETMWGEPDALGVAQRVPITAENALAWYQYTFDAYPENYIEGFVTNQKAEVIPNT